MDAKNRLDKAAENYAIKAQKAAGRTPRGIVSTQVLGLLIAVADELEKQREINSKIIHAIEWLTEGVAENNTWIARITKEITSGEAADENRVAYHDGLRRILPYNLLNEKE